ncbi:uncharacterized protein CTRU02_203688 [Colletotrichum truncatum]|uniref:Uncharacterized protein n=1 Tax=Colletotrichum truncatum TaxID=5467 RepID=A0ACC3ZA12_COLTU|nr:uncharacterized protein CTRU02_04020 [Colletotrichum truncatum]KAF6796060.1 hypothetical protein CTRU02_04020 [Colletotrichum truncatum]
MFYFLSSKKLFRHLTTPKMAIIDTLPAVSVSVRLGTSTRDADEYPDPYPYKNSEPYLDNFEQCSRNYIESEDGVEFAVQVDVLDEESLDPWVYGDYGLVFLLFIDGQFIRRRFCHSDDFLNRRWQFTFNGKKYPDEARSVLIHRKFKFHSISTVNEDASKQEIRLARNLGVIEQPWYDSYHISEEALKGRAISHGTSFAQFDETPLRPLRREQRAAFEKIWTGPLVAMYTFKYRSWEAQGANLCPEAQGANLCPEALKIVDVVHRTPERDSVTYRKKFHYEQSAANRFEELHTRETNKLARERCMQIKDERLQTFTKKRNHTDFCEPNDDSVTARPYKIIRLGTGKEAIDLTGYY